MTILRKQELEGQVTCREYLQAVMSLSPPITVQTWAPVVGAIPHSTNACAETEGTDRHSKSAGFNGMEIKSNNNNLQ